MAVPVGSPSLCRVLQLPKSPGYLAVSAVVAVRLPIAAAVVADGDTVAAVGADSVVVAAAAVVHY